MTTFISLLKKFQTSSDQVAKWAAVALLIGAPTSIALVNIATLLLMLGWIFSGQFRAKWEIIRHNPLTLPCLLLAALILLGVSYTPAPWPYVGKHFYVYSKLVVMLMLLTLLHEPLWQQRGKTGFMAGCLVTLASTYTGIWFDIPWSDSHGRGLGANTGVFNDYIAQGLAMSFFGAMCVQLLMKASTRNRKIGWGLLVGLTVFSITHLLVGRTGQVVLLGMSLAVVLFSVQAKWRWPSIGFIVVLAGLLFFTSTVMQQKVLLIMSESESYLRDGVVKTSIGARLDMWKQALDMFFASPFYGNGTASYRVLAEQIYTDKGQCAVSCIHPHNQFLFFAAEFGMLGLLGYGLLIQRPFTYALALPPQERVLLVAFLTMLFIDSFINGPLWVTTERHFFTAVLPLLMAGWRLQMVNSIQRVAPQLKTG